jgi:hypothetical protein
VTAHTAKCISTRIRVGNGFPWAVTFVIGAVLWPFVSVYLGDDRLVCRSVPPDPGHPAGDGGDYLVLQP